MGFFNEAVRGFGWMTGLRAIVRILTLVKIAILARILLPEQFGVYGIALLVLGILEMVTETGINVFLIQEEGKTEKYLNSAWVVSMIRGLIISLVIVIFAPAISRFFAAPNATPLLYMIAAVGLIRGFINPMAVEFQKTLNFKKEFLFQSALFLTDGSIAVILGILTKSESALIWGMIAAAILEVVLSFAVFKTWPKFSADFAKVKKVVAAGKWVLGAGFFSYLFQNIDNIVVGKILGTGALGLYQQAYKISTLPVTEVSLLFNKVTFPVFVKISGDIDRLKKAYRKTLILIFGLVLPFGLILTLFSRPIMLIVLGPNWLSGEPVLKILALYGVVKSLLNSSYSVFLSLKLQKVIMLTELAGIAGIAILIIPLTAKFGILGAAYSVFLGSVLTLPVVIYNLIKVFNAKK